MQDQFPKIIASKSESELRQIYIEPSLYQQEFRNLAKEELIRRGHSVMALEIMLENENEKQERIYAEGKKGNQIYLVVIGLSAAAGGVPALVGGYLYAFSKRKSNLGNSFYVYNEATRSRGKMIFFVGVAVLVWKAVSYINKL